MTDTLPIPLQVTLGLEHHAATCRRVRLALLTGRTDGRCDCGRDQ
jgi:hypothetical protein